MKSVCIDGHNLALPKGSGIATYARSLLTAIRGLHLGSSVLYGLDQATSPDPLAREISVEDARVRSKPGRLTPNRRLQAFLAPLGRKAYRVDPTERVLCPGGGRADADAFWLSDDLFRIASRAFSDHRTLTPVDFQGPGSGRPDLMHWTYPTPLRARGIVNIYTFHDLIPLRLPHTTLDDKNRYLDLCRAIVARADHIVAVSDTTKRDIVALLGVEQARITTTWQTVDLPADALTTPAAAVAKEIEDVFSLSWKGYFIFFGAIEPKKNLKRLVEAYLRSGVSTPLVIIGRPAWLADNDVGFLDEIAFTGSAAAGRIRRYDFLPRTLLIKLVRGAQATLFPSLYEGFGLPALEAMMLDTPVLASTCGSLPEVSGDAALLVNPYDVEAMAGAIRTLDADGDLRAHMSEAGRVQAERFSPDAYRARVKNLYDSLGC